MISARVKDIVLEPGKDENYDDIGLIIYEDIIDPDRTGEAKPFFSFIKNYPLKNEIVYIITSVDAAYVPDSNVLAPEQAEYYISSVNIWNHQHHNALPDLSTDFEDPDKQINLSNYTEAENGLALRQISGDNTPRLELGNYFRETLNIKPLLPYEGDIIVEGRFGNSIRFGSTNRSGDISQESKNSWSNGNGLPGDPITIIRNGQSSNLDSEGWKHTTENINDDLSSIYLTSNQQLSSFSPASIHQMSFGANLVKKQTKTQELVTPILKENIEPDFSEENLIVESAETDTPISLTIEGCTDPNATNFNNEASVDDGSCTYIEENFIVESETDTLYITYHQNINLGNTHPTDNLVEVNGGTNQNIGNKFTLNHLIATGLTKVKRHPEAVYEVRRAYFKEGKKDPITDVLGFYIEEAGLTKRITVKNSKYEEVYYNGQVSAKNSPNNIAVSIATAALNGDRSTEEMVDPDWPPYDPSIVNKDTTPNNYPGIDKEIPGDRIVENLKKVITNCIDPLFNNSPFSNSDIIIKSAYRSKEINRLIGGSPSDNEHIRGQAIDFKVEGHESGRVWEWCFNNLDTWHQLMWCYPERGTESWIHVSYIEGENKKFTTLASYIDELHEVYEGERRGLSNQYQDGITEWRDIIQDDFTQTPID